MISNWKWCGRRGLEILGVDSRGSGVGGVSGAGEAAIRVLAGVHAPAARPTPLISMSTPSPAPSLANSFIPNRLYFFRSLQVISAVSLDLLLVGKCSPSKRGLGGFEGCWRGFRHRSGRPSFFPERLFSVRRTKNGAKLRQKRSAWPPKTHVAPLASGA